MTSTCTDACTDGAPRRRALRRLVAEERGQATVEAALLLPVLLLCMTLLVQPACLLYTRCVMQQAAAEGCRVLTTAPDTAGVADQTYRAFVLRRLGAVPDIDIFHVGGDAGWRISFSGPSDGYEVGVSIETSVKPLPLFGTVASLFLEGDGEGGVLLKVDVSATLRPSWLEGSYGVWSSIWG